MQIYRKDCSQGLAHVYKDLFSIHEDLDMRTPARELYVAFKIPYVYVYITNLGRSQAKGRSNPNPLKPKCTLYWTIRSQAYEV
jgi:hypothetical protein